MNIHKNARLTPRGRERLIRSILGGTLTHVAAEAAGVCERTARKWVARFEAEGTAGLLDRSSRPHRMFRPTPGETVAQVEGLRRQRWTGKRIALELSLSPATVSRILRRLRLSRMRDPEPAEPVRRYEHERPGDMIHLDIKKLGRFDRVGHRITGDRTGQSNACGAGWEFVHVAIDDASRLAFSHIMPDEKAVSAVAALKAAVAHYQSLGITPRRVMTDNGSCYISKAFRLACRDLGLRHVRTRPYTPRTNGKAERFIQTALREWAYARAYPSSQHRAEALPAWIPDDNWHRPYGGIWPAPIRWPSSNLMHCGFGPDPDFGPGVMRVLGLF